jgi:CheY-like chemotaxis protein
VLILTADATGAGRTQRLEQLASGFMTKPISVQSLLDTIDRYVGDPLEAAP